MDNSSVKTIDISNLPDSSNLFLEFASRPSLGLSPYLDGIPSNPDSWSSRMESSLKTREEFLNRIDISKHRAMMEKLIEYNSKLGLGKDILIKMERAIAGKACFVITGQQPGVLGGPLMVLYKAVTAVALSERIERMLSMDCIPLFWIGSDDTDFQEIKSLFFLSDDLSVKMATLPSEAHESSRPIGEISSHWSREVWDNVKTSLSKHPGYDYVEGTVNKATELGADHAEVAAIMLLELLGGKLAIIDGRDASLRSFSKELFLNYLEHEEAIKASLKRIGEEMHQHGYHSQITTTSDSGIFLMAKGRRTKVPPENIGELRNVIISSIENCSPGVVLRNLVQDYSFMPLAVVLGPAELAYRAQMYDIYRMFDIPMPIPIPRMTATFLPEKMQRYFLDAGIALDLIVANPREAARFLFAKRSEARDAVEEFLSTVDGCSTKLKKKLRSQMKSTTFIKLEKQLYALVKRLERLLDLVDESAREEILQATPWLKDVENLIRPRNMAQERSFSMLLPFLVTGERGTDLQMELGRRYVDNLLGGSIMHLLYTV